MIAIITCALILGLVVLLIRWFAAIPLIGAVSAGIDAWADGVHGSEPGPLR